MKRKYDKSGDDIYFKLHLSDLLHHSFVSFYFDFDYLLACIWLANMLLLRHDVFFASESQAAHVSSDQKT
jgi:hypothetical protein